MDRVPQAEPRAFLSSTAARFTVEESFRGAAAPGAEMVVYTGAGGGDCGYPFVPGTSYLVYASRDADGRLHTSICSQTQPAVRVGGTLRELRAARDRKQTDMIFGTVGMAPRGSGFDDLVESRPLAGVPVRATESHGQPVTTQTDELGAYAFTGLASGHYTVEVDLPAGFAKTGGTGEIEVSSSEAACRIDTFARPDGRIAGMVVDPDGQPMPGFVMLEPADPAERAKGRGGLSGEDVGADGKFTLSQVPPGRYRLMFHPDVRGTTVFSVSFYWPPEPGGAIEVGFGQHVDGLMFRAGAAR